MLRPRLALGWTRDAAAKWNKALLDNAARPSGALIYSACEGAVLTDNQFERQVTKAPFLTVNEKRAMTGFGPLEGGDRLL